MKHILACIDASPYAARVCNLAAWSAKRLDASVELLHAIQRTNAAASRKDLSGAIGLGVKSSLLEELTRLDEAEGKLAIERGRVLLESAKDHVEGLGVTDIELTHRHGGIVETITEREADADLIVIGKRGGSADFAKGHIGSKVERVVRASHKPVVVASSRGPDLATSNPTKILVAFDGGGASTAALTFAAMSVLFADLPLEVVIAGGDDARHRKLVEQATALLASHERAGEVIRRDGAPETVIGETMKANPDGFLVMGAYGHSPLRTLIVGSTTTAMIRTVHAPVLLVRP
ncbi:MAG: universal stress protein [Rhizobiales bacterium]|nr:universal stress protein [Hyphomicrobiales bacterium]MBO6698499.1 universal stress protein [Hyphomicrobiales bacterium]MBO6735247.1 universal stress protein [Hyphomicrobiales bacterium]MBO6910945.1 universal stress protein [Hyphomicrobiales bacterium]MBO6955988.1 universal stress protein [Hyphomicrobiales bacterium]